MQRQNVTVKARYTDINTLTQRLRAIFPDDPDIPCKVSRGFPSPVPQTATFINRLRSMSVDTTKSSYSGHSQRCVIYRPYRGLDLLKYVQEEQESLEMESPNHYSDNHNLIQQTG